MLSTFKPLHEHVPLRASEAKFSKPQSESLTSRLHYRVTVTFILTCCVLVTCLEWIGNGSKISCVLEGDVDDWTIPQNVIDTYCFIATTFILPKHFNHSGVGSSSAAFGVGPYNPTKDEARHKAYYQWVPFVLLLQAVMFYVPHVLFKAWEGGKIRAIVVGLNRLIVKTEDRNDKQKTLANYFADSINTHNTWAVKLQLVEVLNLANAVFNIYFIDLFLGHEFSTYGVDVVNFVEADPEARVDPMAMVFPRMTKCTFRKYGPSGTIQNHDALCVLPINSVNEKIYVFLWFWLIALSCLTALSLLYHLILLIVPKASRACLRRRALLHRREDARRLDEVGLFCQMGDWRLLHMLARNLEPIVFTEFLMELHAKLRRRSDSDVTLANDEVAIRKPNAPPEDEANNRQPLMA